MVPPLPSKALKRQMPFRSDDGIYEEGFIEERRSALEAFVNKIAGGFSKSPLAFDSLVWWPGFRPPTCPKWEMSAHVSSGGSVIKDNFQTFAMWYFSGGEYWPELRARQDPEHVEKQMNPLCRENPFLIHPAAPVILHKLSPNTVLVFDSKGKSQ